MSLIKTFHCESCNKSLFSLDLYRDKDGDNQCESCYLEDGKRLANYYVEEDLYNLTLSMNDKETIAYHEMKEATIEDLERVIKLKAFL